MRVLDFVRLQPDSEQEKCFHFMSMCCVLLQAFTELQAKVIDTQQKARLADLQIDQLTKVQKHARLTQTEMASLPDNTRLYEGVGRM